MESNTGPTNKVKPDVSVMLKKLDGLYDKEEHIKKQIKKLYFELEQLQQDKELLQMMIMHTSNKKNLYNKYKRATGK